jgi:hypothetical protein
MSEIRIRRNLMVKSPRTSIRYLLELDDGSGGLSIDPVARPFEPRFIYLLRLGEAGALLR